MEEKNLPTISVYSSGDFSELQTNYLRHSLCRQFLNIKLRSNSSLISFAVLLLE